MLVEPIKASISTIKSVPMVASFSPVCFRVLGATCAGLYGLL